MLHCEMSIAQSLFNLSEILDKPCVTFSKQSVCFDLALCVSFAGGLVTHWLLLLLLLFTGIHSARFSISA